jgi:hypothetical protein
MCATHLQVWQLRGLGLLIRLVSDTVSQYFSYTHMKLQPRNLSLSVIIFKLYTGF